jgi:1,2-phenylacetyl-CoA epoxidase catalytic subunit
MFPLSCPFPLPPDPLLQLFGASAVTKDYALGVKDYSKATWTQNFIASIAGAVASITVAAPLDVVKTRIQNANFESKVGGFTVVKELIKHEGPTAFFKGLTPKVCPLPWFESQ